jgi:hypothetical protein
MTVSFVAIAVAQSQLQAQTQPASLIVAGIAVVALAALVSARYASVAVGAREISVGARARQHRERLIGQPEPQHPQTAGRPRTRAPSRGTAAA